MGGRGVPVSICEEGAQAAAANATTETKIRELFMAFCVRVPSDVDARCMGRLATASDEWPLPKVMKEMSTIPIGLLGFEQVFE